MGLLRFFVLGSLPLIFAVACDAQSRSFEELSDAGQDGGGLTDGGTNEDVGAGGNGGDKDAGQAGDTSGGELELTTTSLELEFNRSIDLELMARGGEGTREWSLVEEAELPEGLSLEAEGRLVGRPIEAGQFVVGIRITDGDEQSIERELELTVSRTKRWLAYIADHETFDKDELYIYDLLNPAQPARLIALDGADDVLFCEFSPDGTKLGCIADVDGSKSLFAVDVVSGESSRVSGEVVVNTNHYQLGWAPDSSRIAFTGQTEGPADLYVAEGAAGDPGAPLPVADLGDSEPVFEALWIGAERLIVASPLKLYSVALPKDGAPKSPQELLIPNVATLPSPPTFKRPTREPNLVFFYLGDFNLGNAYVADFRSGSGTIVELAEVSGSGWQPSVDGTWLSHRLPSGQGFETRGPVVRAIDAPDEVWERTGSGPAFWSQNNNRLFWIETEGSVRLMQTTFASESSTEEHALGQETLITALADDDRHLLLEQGSTQLLLWDGSALQPLQEGETTQHSFAPNAATYAYRLGTALRVGRVGEDANGSTFTTSDEADQVNSYAWSADGAVLVYLADRATRGAQLFKTEVLKGKPSGQSVHPIANCVSEDCPAVKAFVLQP